ncbi:MAG: N-acetyltransferase [Clostridia bacterium]|nr:N-acetyltransferase [Clostridia bacterium]
MVEIKEVLTKKDRKKFFKFPLTLYKGVKNSCPQLISDEKDEFDENVNGAFKYADAKMFLAIKGGKVVGRVAAILNKAYNEKQNIKELRFSRIDFIDDHEVSGALIGAVKAWAKELGMTRLVGPIGFSDLDKQGMLVDGFDEMNLYLTVYNFPYYVEHMERLGMEKIVDWVEYRIKTPEKGDERADELCEKILKRFDLKIIKTNGANSAKDIVIKALKDIWNEAYAPLYGVVEINEKQIEREFNMIKMIWKDDNVAAIEKDGELIAYGFVGPNLSRALSKCNGRLLPFGIFHLLWDINHSDAVDCYSIGIKKEYKDRGINFIMVNGMMNNLRKNGIKYIYTGPMLEHNKKIRSQWEQYDPELYRRRRCFGLDIE